MDLNCSHHQVADCVSCSVAKKINSHLSTKARFHPHGQGEGTRRSQFLRWWGDQTSRLGRPKEHTGGSAGGPLLFLSPRTGVITVFGYTLAPGGIQFKIQYVTNIFSQEDIIQV